ncbi:MmpL5 protein [Mycolicibacterium conceptionense]|uniref:MmpL5 protein n=1 Tax=Mycolicibacterium conceptionense TaxID=451644 RepID=A0A0U1DRH0_9MYCO|nr:MmpL5 protein [Mycolicibacterium conceptionense]
MADSRAPHTGIARWIRRFAIPVIVGWIALLAFLSATVPPLEVVGQMRSVSMSPDEAPSVIAMKRVGKVFDEFHSDSSAMIVLEAQGDGKLDADAHRFYNDMVDRLEADKKHVEHVQDFWGDPLTEAGAQSNDGKAAYVQVYLAGNMGEALANESVEAVQKLIAELSPPPGLKVYVTGPTALAADQQISGDRSVKIIEGVTFAVIITMLLLVYRSIITVILVLLMVVVELSAARGFVAFLGYHNLIGLSTFATQLLVTLAIAAATDYAIFLIGRYQEARSVGEDREQAYYTMFHGTAHVVLGSGMTIAGATLCLHFTRLPYFQTLGIPMAVGMTVTVLAALTLGPAIITVASRFGKVLEPKRAMRIRFWRRLAPSSCAGLVRCCSAPSCCRWSACSRCPAIAPITTTATTCPPTCRHRRLRRSRPALLGGEDESRVAAHRNRPRRTQFGGFPGDRPDRQASLRGARSRQRAGHHPPAG